MTSNFHDANSTLDNDLNQYQIKSSGQSHSFDTGIAYHVGIKAAIVFNHITFWLRINKAKGTNFIEGRTWIYETYDEMVAYFGYLSKKEIRTAVEVLIEKGLLIKAYHCKNKFDRKTWYALADEKPISLPCAPIGTSMCQNGQMDVLDESHQKCQSGHISLYTDKEQDQESLSKDKDAPASPAPLASPKKNFIDREEKVKTTEEEHKKLVEKYGLPFVLLCYAELSDWKQRQPPAKIKKYDDYRAILKWVAIAIQKRQLDELEINKRQDRLKNPQSQGVDRRTKNQDGSPMEAPHLEGLF